MKKKRFKVHWFERKKNKKKKDNEIKKNIESNNNVCTFRDDIKLILFEKRKIKKDGINEHVKSGEKLLSLNKVALL